MSLVSMIIADRIESATKYYDRWMNLITWGQDKRVREAALGYIDTGDRILDVGCGTATLAVKAAQKGAQVTGFDLSPAMLRLAEEKARTAGVEVNFRRGHAQSPPLDDEPFDTITATFALSEMSPDEAEMVVADMAARLKVGGRMIVADEARPTNFLLRLSSGLQRAVVALLTFIAIEERPTRLHDLRGMVEAVGMTVTEEQRFQGGALWLVMAERRGEITRPQREIMEPVIHRGIKGAVYDFLCWLFVLPLAVKSGLYRLGKPNPASPLFLTSNFYMTFKAVVKALQGRDCWLLVEDSEGWNVWCATDTSVFNAEKAWALMRAYDLEETLDHPRIVIPLLGGKIAHRLKKLTGWEIIKGPIQARDLPEFIENDFVTTPAMRSLDRYYDLPHRLRIGTLSALLAPICVIPFLFVLREYLALFLAFGVSSSFVLAIFHYWIPGRTGIVKELVLGALLSVGWVGWTIARSIPLTTRLAWALLAILVYCFIYGYTYQASTPVIYWKRIWK
ncbi:MAG: methyltransferase domain-containing protein [Anaerolineae bacterium]|nr:methyltransferase domain-containing protein [Anaerolineae bacterium]